MAVSRTLSELAVLELFTGVKRRLLQLGISLLVAVTYN